MSHFWCFLKFDTILIDRTFHFKPEVIFNVQSRGLVSTNQTFFVSEPFNSLIRKWYAYVNEEKKCKQRFANTQKKLTYQSNPLDDLQALHMWKRAKLVSNFLSQTFFLLLMSLIVLKWAAWKKMVIKQILNKFTLWVVVEIGVLPVTNTR